MPVGQRPANDPFLFAKRDGLYIVLAFALAMITLRLPMDFWQRHGTAMLIASIVMLLIVLVVGSSVNGASRWIALGPLRIQPAEFTKLSLFCYIANYLVRKADEVRNNLRGFLKPMGVIFVLAILLLAQLTSVPWWSCSSPRWRCCFSLARSCGSSSPLSAWVFRRWSC